MNQSRCVTYRLLALLLVGSILPACGGSGAGSLPGTAVVRSFDPAPLTDTQPPALTVSVAQQILFPANGKMVDVGLAVLATDDSGETPDVTVRVFSNEPDNPSDPNASPASLFRLHELPLFLRAKRDGGSAGRVYLIVARARDGSGNFAFAGTTVVVPRGNSANALQAVQALAAQALATLTANGSVVTPFPVGTFVNTAPVALNDAYSTTGAPIQVAAPGVLGNDVEVDLDALTAILTQPPAHGTLALQADGSFIYTPNAGFQGTDSFRYVATDGWTTSNTATVTLTVSSTQDTTTTVTTSGSPTVFGQPVTFTATVTPTSPGSTPTGTVLFVETTQGITLGSLTLNASGVATLQITALPVGARVVQANYQGSPDFNPSSGSVAHVVNQGATLTQLTSSLNPSGVGQPVTFTATVTPIPPSAGTPSGSVTFVDTTAGTTLGTVTLSGSGQATLTTNSLSQGNRTILATYAGSSGFAGSSGSLVQTVLLTSLPTTTNLTSTTNPSVFGQTLTLTATVSAAPFPQIPTGLVTFSDTTNGITLGTVAFTGVATLTVSSLSVGTLTLQATYTGGPGFDPSTGTTTQTVIPGATVTVLTGSPNPSTAGQPVTFTATVIPVAPSSATPTGTVTFVDTAGGITLGTVALDSFGHATLTTNSLSVGTHPIVATYSGSTQYSSSAGSHAQTIQPPPPVPTTMNFTASPSPSNLGQPVVLTATLSAAPFPQIPTGTVTFSFSISGTTTVLGTVALDATGVATLTVSALPQGLLVLNASYSGGPGFDSIAFSRVHTVN